MQQGVHHAYGFVTGLCKCGCGEKTPLATRTYNKLGIKKGKPLSYLPGHQHHKAPVAFEEDPETGCWLWRRGLTKAGYALVTVDGRRQYAHRVLWEEFFGPIPADWEADHLCLRPACVNPGHIEPVPPGLNQQRQHERAREAGRRIGAVAYART